MAIETLDLTKGYELLTAVDKLNLKVSLGTAFVRLPPHSSANAQKDHGELSIREEDLFGESFY
ncbi:MAG TPA: hypothetical protein VK487_05425 [Candidatus Bathyarchaeia archaeon]|nr:hypothetical protein [Candidatus Bathyarchaeia archaeon]